MILIWMLLGVLIYLGLTSLGISALGALFIMGVVIFLLSSAWQLAGPGSRHGH